MTGHYDNPGPGNMESWYQDVLSIDEPPMPRHGYDDLYDYCRVYLREGWTVYLTHEELARLREMMRDG